MKKTKFYSIPLLNSDSIRTIDPEASIDDAVKKIKPRLTLEKSVRQNIQLLLMTFPNKVKGDPLFGCLLNKYNFQTPNKRQGEQALEDEIKDLVRKNLNFLLEKYEPRLTSRRLSIEVHIPDPTKKAKNMKLKEGRIALEITVNGKLLSSDDFNHTEIRPLL